jgi:hypothetical protein
MRYWKKTLSGLGASALLSTGAMAADVVGPVIVAPPPPAAPMAAPGFDWSGIFIGAFGSVNFETGLGVSWYNVGGQIGYNIVRGRILLGVTGQAGSWINTGGSGFLLQANGRVGFVFDRIVPYALVGYGAYGPSGAVDRFLDIGLGAEIALGQRLSAFGEVRYEWFPGFPPPPHFIRFEFGVNLHPGN